MSRTENTPFLQPFRFRNGVIAKNRVVLAPMTNGQSHRDGTLGDDEFHWLERRAKGGFGTLITCASHIRADAKGWEGELAIYNADHEPGLKRLSGMIRAHDALGLIQIFHGGARSPRALTGQQPVSASAFSLDLPGFEIPRPLTDNEIRAVISDFATAAKRAKDCGFQGVEIHGANGYLITQFLSTATNTRTDIWGGSLENRARFVLEIVRAVKQKTGEKFLLGVRLSPENFGLQTGLDFDEMLMVSKLLSQEGIHFLHLSLGSALKTPSKYSQTKTPISLSFRNALPPDVALIVSGNIWTAADATATMKAGADFVSLGKTAIAHPEWPLQVGHQAFMPTPLPLTAKELSDRGVGDAMVQTLRRMNLVKEER